MSRSRNSPLERPCCGPASLCHLRSALLLRQRCPGKPESGIVLAFEAICRPLRAGPHRNYAASFHLEGLRWFRAPAILLEVIQFVHRYLFLIAEQAQRMAIAARARGARRSFAAVAGSVGVLFARSYDRAEAIHRSMLARGYTGSLPSRERLRFRMAVLPRSHRLCDGSPRVRMSLIEVLGLRYAYPDGS